MNRFDRINNAIEDAEGSIITLVTTLIPWGAPALPAYLTFSHLYNDIGVPWVIALAMAACVEGLGLAAVSTAFSAMRHNKQHRADVRRVSLAFPVAAYVFYLAVVITVNVVLALPLTVEARGYAQVAAVALLTLISAPAFVIAISRQDQRRIDREWQDRKSGRRSPDMGSAIVAKEPVNLAEMTVSDIMATYGVSERTAYRRKAAAQRNGQGAEKIDV